MGVLELKDSRIDQCQSSGGMKASLVEKRERRKELQALKSHIIESSGWAVVVSNHEFFNVLSPNGPLCPCSALPGSLKIIEDLSYRAKGGVSKERELGCGTERRRKRENERVNK